MFVIDSKGAQWSIDEGLRERAEVLMDSFHDKIGYIDLDKIIFLRLSGAAKTKWLGKCMYIGKCPVNIIPKFIVNRLYHMGLLNVFNTSLESNNGQELGNLFDLRYIIAINDDLIQGTEGDVQRVEDVVLYHELRHIHPDEDKLVKHDLEDFRDIVDSFGPYWSEGIFREEVHPEDGEVPPMPSIPRIPLSQSAEDWKPSESD